MGKGRIVRSLDADRADIIRIALRLLGLDGGPGSGNYGHAGRPGKVGGSAKGSGGAAFRTGSKEKGFTSFAKHKEFKGILETAKKVKSVHQFWDKLSDDQFIALEDQFNDTHPDRVSKQEEDFEQYTERLFSCEWIEVVRPSERLEEGYVMIVDEEGLLKENCLNVAGSWLYGTDDHGEPIVGDLLIMKEEYGEEGPDLAGMSEESAIRFK